MDERKESLKYVIDGITEMLISNLTLKIDAFISEDNEEFGKEDLRNYYNSQPIEKFIDERINLLDDPDANYTPEILEEDSWKYLEDTYRKFLNEKKIKKLRLKA